MLALIFCLKFLVKLEQGHTRSFCTRPGELANQPECTCACLHVCVGVSPYRWGAGLWEDMCSGELGKWMRGGHCVPEGARE